MKRQLALLVALTVALTLFAASPAAAAGGDGVECESEAEAGDVVRSTVGVSTASSTIGDQSAVQVAVQNNVQAGNVAIDFGSGDATTIVESTQEIRQNIEQEVCTD